VALAQDQKNSPQLTAAQVTSYIPAVVLQEKEIADKFDPYMPWEWYAPLFSSGNTVDLDRNGFRSELLKHHIWFITQSEAVFAYNLAHAPENPQVFVSEKPTYNHAELMGLTYMPLKNTQFEVTGAYLASDWTGYLGPNIFKFDSLLVNQYLLNRKLLLTLGYSNSDAVFQGKYTGEDTSTGALGVNSIIPFEVGEAHTLAPSLTLNLKYKFSHGLYTLDGIERSQDPKGTNTENARNKLGLRPIPHGDGALYLAEFGYKRRGTPGVKSTWFRINGWYNASHYQDYSSVKKVLTGAKAHSGAACVAFDQQLTQPDKYLPYRGIYVNLTGQYAPPDVAVYHQYYQVSLYSKGLFRARPLDMISLNVNRTVFSRTALNTFEKLPKALNPQFGNPGWDDSTYVSGTYGYLISHGIVLSTNIAYVRHPTYAPNTLDNPVIGTAQLAFYF
jgi:porin